MSIADLLLRGTSKYESLVFRALDNEGRVFDVASASQAAFAMGSQVERELSLH